MPTPEKFPQAEPIEEQQWGEELEAFVERLFIKYAQVQHPFAASFNRIKFVFDGNQSPDEIASLIRNSLSVRHDGEAENDSSTTSDSQ